MRFNPMKGMQFLGQSLMLPIAVLPIAGLLLRLGQPDLLNIELISAAGGAVFSQLGLLFATGVATGIAKDNSGASALAGVIGFLILKGVLDSYAASHHIKLDMGVFGGIMMGALAGVLYNRFKNIKLPDYLSFFGGKRFVPILTGVLAVALGALFSFIWPSIQEGMDLIGKWINDAGGIGFFCYGLLNRLLIVTGLHHVINNLVWFQLGSFTSADGSVFTGDITRFFQHDPTAGYFMSGFFPVMMFGLPAAALAMYHCADKQRKPQVAGMFLSLSLTAFLTGVTEPLEFSFMFLSPLLYALHAVLTGLSLAIMYWLHVRIGFTFSAGAFDAVLSYGISQNFWYLIPVGICYAVVYYTVFRVFITWLDLKVPGRDEAPIESDAGKLANDSSLTRSMSYIRALGGANNLLSVNACTTRLRLEVIDQICIDDISLKALGAKGVLKLKNGNVHVIIGPMADAMADEIRASLKHVQDAHENGPGLASETTNYSMLNSVQYSESVSAELLEALGGANNIVSAEYIASTRVRLRAVTLEKMNETGLYKHGVDGVHIISDNIVHLIFMDEKRAENWAALFSKLD